MHHGITLKELNAAIKLPWAIADEELLAKLEAKAESLKIKRDGQGATTLSALQSAAHTIREASKRLEASNLAVEEAKQKLQPFLRAVAR
jgi:hypothetical protein